MLTEEFAGFCNRLVFNFKKVLIIAFYFLDTFEVCAAQLSPLTWQDANDSVTEPDINLAGDAER